jgi:hypothetical protein
MPFEKVSVKSVVSGFPPDLFGAHWTAPVYAE